MLESVKISRRQSEIRQTLAGLVGKQQPSEDETRQMESLDSEYRSNETRYRAALIAEDTERRDAKDELETRGGREWSDLIDRFELRQVALALDEGRALEGATAEVVQEMRAKGGYRGVPVPWLSLERRVGETVASGVPDPKVTRPIIDRLFPDSVASRMGVSLITIDQGSIEWPVCTQGASVGWATSETGSVGAAQAYQTVDKALAPNNTLGCRMLLTRKSLKQSGAALEAAVRRDMNAAMQAEMDRIVFQGSGANGEPLGVIPGAATYGINVEFVSGAATWASFRTAVVNFLTANAAAGPGAVRMLIRPETWDLLDGTLIAGTGISEWDRLVRHIPAGNIAISAGALDATSPGNAAVLAVTAGGVPPVFVGAWGGVDLIRDPYSDAASGGLRLTALATLDVTVARGSQVEILTNLE